MAIFVPSGNRALWSSVKLFSPRRFIQWSQIQVLGTILRFPFPVGKAPETLKKNLAGFPAKKETPPYLFICFLVPLSWEQTNYILLLLYRF